MIIRPYTPADKSACIAAFKSNMPRFFAPAELPDFEEWLREQDARYTSSSKNNKEQYYVAVLEEEVIGCGGYYIDAAGQEAKMTWGFIKVTRITTDGYGPGLDRYDMELPV